MRFQLIVLFSLFILSIIFITFSVFKKRTFLLPLNIFLAIAAISYFIFFIDRSHFQNRPKNQRASLAASTSNSIDLALVLSQEQSSFKQGIELAVEEINKNGGIALQRKDRKDLKIPILLHQFIEEEKQYQWYLPEQINQWYLPEQIAENNNIIAVLGHASLKRAMSAAISYENNGIVFFSSTLSSLRFNQNGFHYAFSNMPNALKISQRLFTFVDTNGLKKIILLSSRTQFKSRLALSLKRIIAHFNQTITNKTKIKTIKEFSYINNPHDMQELLGKLVEHSFDILILTNRDSRTTADIIQQIRRTKPQIPIVLGIENLNLIHLGKNQNKPMDENLFVITPFCFQSAPYQQDSTTIFLEKFIQKYNKPPDYIAAQGYETIKLLAQAWEKSGTVEPEKVVLTLKSGEPFQGLTGMYSFSSKGEIIDKPIFLSHLKRTVHNNQYTDGHCNH